MVTQSSSATASLNFKIHIPATLYLQIRTIALKKDENVSDESLENEPSQILQDKNSSLIKTSGLVFKGGMIFLNPGSKPQANGLHSKTNQYILSSP